MDSIKQQVHDFWNDASCGENLYLHGDEREDFDNQAQIRYSLEPYIAEFADFAVARGKRVLEIGVGLGADHQRFAEAGADLWGIDLTERAIEIASRRLRAYGLSSMMKQGDAEQLDFPDEWFDVVYSWGVLHHSPDTRSAISEVRRVLRPGGVAKVMIYHKWSLVGLMLWLRYAMLRGKPWLSLGEIYARHLESPGTKAYTTDEARQLFADFRDVRIRTVLTHGDMLESRAGQRHRGLILSLAKKMWPRVFLRRTCPQLGLFMLIDAKR